MPTRLMLPFLIACTSACTKWQAQPAPPPQLLAERQPDKIRVTRTDRSRAVLLRPGVVNDSMYGVLDESRVRIDRDGPRASRHGAREAIALSQVSEVAIRKTDPVGTSLLVASGLFLGYFLISLNNLDR